jgi:glutamyl-tRNA reductase
MPVELFVLGTSTSVAPEAVRERLHIDLDEVYAGLRRLTRSNGLVDEAVPLATCGRLEVYGLSSRPDRAIRVLRDLVATRTGVARGELDAHSYIHRGDEAARHLFGVASGLESVIYGEAQILGQVHDALHHPSTEAVAGTFMTRLFQSALAAGKRVRAETDIGRGSASIAGAALRLLDVEAGTLVGRTVLVIGAGDTGALVARLLRKERVGRLLIANRTLEHAIVVAEELGGEAYGLEALPELLLDADIVVGAVAGRDDLVTSELLASIAAADAKPRHFLDLSHPRSFSPDIADIDGVELLDLARVFARVEAARGARAAQVPHARAIVDAEVESFAEWVRSRQTASVLRAVREQVMEMARVEAHRRSRGLSEAERENMQRFAHSLARTLLHTPTLAIRAADPGSPEGRWLLRSATSLFGVPGEDLGDRR